MVIRIARLLRQPNNQALDHRTPFRSDKNGAIGGPPTRSIVLHRDFISWPFYMGYPLQLTLD